MTAARRGAERAAAETDAEEAIAMETVVRKCRRFISGSYEPAIESVKRSKETSRATVAILNAKRDVHSRLRIRIGRPGHRNLSGRFPSMIGGVF